MQYWQLGSGVRALQDRPQTVSHRGHQMAAMAYDIHYSLVEPDQGSKNSVRHVRTHHSVGTSRNDSGHAAICICSVSLADAPCDRYRRTLRIRGRL